MKQTILLFLVFFRIIAMGQYDYGSYKSSRLINNYTEGTFTVYDTMSYKVNMVKSEGEVDWTDIGNVVMSKIYANTPDWTLNIYEDTTGVVEDSSHYAGVQQITTKNEFIRPICTYYYTVEGEEAALTFCTWQTKEGDGEIPLTMAAVKKNGRWYASRRLHIFGIEQIIFAFREQVLAHIFKGEETGDFRLNKLMKKVRKNGVVDIEKLFDELILLKLNTDPTDYEFYTRAGKPTAFPEFKPMDFAAFTSKVIQPMEVPDLKIYKYRKYEYYVDGEPQKQWISELALINNVQKSATDTLRFEYRYTFIWDGHPFSIIKYRVGNTQFANILELINGIWIISDNLRFENFRYFMQVIKKKNFNDFHSVFVWERDQTIKKYSSLYSQKMHNSNMDKLGVLLKTKPKELEPYCDFE